jgi:hypothetical protein
MPLTSIDAFPCSYQDLKDKATEAMIVLYNEHNLENAIMTLENHLPGKWAWKSMPGHYGRSRLRFKRSIEWSGRASYSPKTGECTLEQCAFGLNLWRLRDEWRSEERADPYHAPALFPEAELSAEKSLESLLLDPSGLRYVDYSKKPTVIYAARGEEQKHRSMYDTPYRSTYQRGGQKIRAESQDDEKGEK